jgi:hypothetical protein
MRYTGGTPLPAAGKPGKDSMNRIGRNDPCPCGSGLKYKQCCLDRERSPQRVETPESRRIEDLLDGGYDLVRADRLSEACEAWVEAWRMISARLRPTMRSCDAARKAYSGKHFLSNWIQDYAEALQNAALTDRRQAQAGIAFCTDVLARFPDEDALTLENFRGDLGMLHFKAGRLEEGKKVLQGLIRDLPHRSIGYALLSDMLGEDGHPWTDGKALDRPLAITLLEQALARPVEDAGDYDLEFRLEHLRRAAADQDGRS